ncbi:MAG: hypothetical protein WC185_04515 [Acholeplasmataceae bacterium]
MKKCTKCKRELDESKFSKLGDGLQFKCKDCYKEYYTTNHAKLMEQKQDYYIRTKPRHQAQMRKQYLNKYAITRSYYLGELNPDSTTGIGVLTEHIVYIALNDCKKCNVIGDFSFPCDLISKKYGTINVKSAKIYKNCSEYWSFRIPKAALIPNYYFCLGFNTDRSEISHVWIIPGNCELIAPTKIHITNSKKGLNKWKEYEVDVLKYNNIYKNLNIKSLPEFSNIHVIENETT